jgi:negative regulator of replication initiation
MVLDFAMKHRLSIFFIVPAVALFLSGKAEASPSAAFMPDTSSAMSEALSRADNLRLQYKFRESVDAYKAARDAEPDSAAKVMIDEAMVTAQNGLSMMEYCGNPVVVARKKLSVNDFFLYYPLPSGSWRSVPNVLDSLGPDTFAKAVYAPKGTTSIYYSAKDQDGIRNIFRVVDQDSIWSAPELLNESVTSSEDEVYPMVSTDGKKLFFASKGLYGMGGYDLYEAEWDDELGDWGVPVNLGFPYSSPYNDVLFANSPDGKYSIFASDRDCPDSDSLWVYVVEYDDMPVRTAVDNESDLRRLAELRPAVQSASGTSSDTEDAASNSELRQYADAVRDVRELKQSVYNQGIALSSESSAEALSALAATKDSLAAAQKRLQEIEMKFFANGVVIDPDKLQKATSASSQKITESFEFTKASMGAPLAIRVAAPKQAFDYSFKVLPEGRFAEDNNLPSGLVYQIQLFTSSRKATVKDLRGLSPVFWRRKSNGSYVYSAGLFRTYKDVLSNLNKAKRAGFRYASIIAFRDGKPLDVRQARKAEADYQPLWSVRIWPLDGKSLGESEMKAIRSLTSADIAKSSEGGVVSYLIGPFSDTSELDSVISGLRSAGITNVRSERLPRE